MLQSNTKKVSSDSLIASSTTINKIMIVQISNKSTITSDNGSRRRSEWKRSKIRLHIVSSCVKKSDCLKKERAHEYRNLDLRRGSKSRKQIGTKNKKKKKKKKNRSGCCTWQIWIIRQAPPAKLAQQNSYRNDHRPQTSADPFSGYVEQKSTRSPLTPDHKHESKIRNPNEVRADAKRMEEALSFYGGKVRDRRPR